MTREVDVAAVLAARDRRYRHQQDLLARYGVPLVSFTMNIAGPVKRNALIDRAFALTLQRLEQQLRRCGFAVLHRETVREDTGCEALYAVDGDAAALKELCMALEEDGGLGRLLDLDVLDRDGSHLTRSQERRCLICGAAGKSCARSRAHTVAELQQRTREILTDALHRHDAMRIGELATRALLWEACAAPKPGLVDRLNSGSHTDMDIFTFMSSAAALQPFFARCAAVGQQTVDRPPAETFRALRRPGMVAEGEMLRATDGVNTHRGAVFLMGLACAAMGRLGSEIREADTVLDECAAMAAGVTAELTQNESTAGARLYRTFGLRGIRGEAEDGFPSVRRALPVLEAALADGKTPEEAARETLPVLMTLCEDTALVHRAGYEGWLETKQYAADVLRRGATCAELEDFDRWMTERRRSPGGSADLLGLCWLLHFWENEKISENNSC